MIKRLLLIVFLALFLTGIGAYANWYLLSHYRAEALLFQENGSLPTSLDLITLKNNLQTVKSILGLDLTEQELEKMVRVAARSGSSFIPIIVTSDNPHLAIDIANTVAQVAVRNSQELNQRHFKNELAKSQNQLDEASSQLKLAVEALEHFQKAHPYLEIPADYVQARSKANEANLHYQSLLIESQNLKRAVDKMPAVLESGVDPDQAHIMALQLKLAEAKARYAPENPKIAMLQDQLNALVPKKQYERNEHKEQLQVELVRLEGKRHAAQKVKEELAAALKELESLKADQLTFKKLLKERETVEERLVSLTKTVELMQSLPKGGVELYQPAEKAKPLQEGWWVGLLPLFGMILGISCGTLLQKFYSS